MLLIFAKSIADQSTACYVHKVLSILPHAHEIARFPCQYSTVLMWHFMQVVEQKDAIVSVSMEASQEAALEDLLDKMSAKWNHLEFSVLPFKDVKDAFILGSVEEVTATLEDSLVTMATILASRCLHWHLASGQHTLPPLQPHAWVAKTYDDCNASCKSASVLQPVPGAAVRPVVLINLRKHSCVIFGVTP